MIYANEMQHKAIKSTKEITLLTNGCGSGQSYALILKALSSDCKNISLFINFNLGDIEDILKDCQIKYRLSKKSNIFTLSCGKKIKVIRGYGLLKISPSTDLILVDNIHNFPLSFIDEILDSKVKKVFTSYPFKCGYCIKQPLNLSWDYTLINWRVGVENCIPEDYGDNVEVITGYGANTYLNDSYLDFLDSLPDQQVKGSWFALKE